MEVAATPAVVFEHITKRFARVVAVDDICARVPTGSIYGFLGPNGAGKTTALRLIMGILEADAGSLHVLGAEAPAMVKHRLGYLPEEKGLYKKMRVRELVGYFGRLKGLPKVRALQRADELLQRFDLSDWCNERCEALSKGMAQKVQIIATLVHDPELLVLDEPFSGLDPVNVQMVRDLVLELRREGRTVLLSTHVMEQAEQICDYLLLINHGRCVLDGKLAEIKSRSGTSGSRTVLLDYDGDGRVLGEIPGVARVRDAGHSAELLLEPGHDPQELLRSLVEKVRVRRFDTRERSLHEIFIEAVEGSR